MKDYTIIGVVALFLLVVFIFGLREQRRNRKKIMARLESSYGKSVEVDRRMAKKGGVTIRNGYYLFHQDGWHVDDITWKDLDMNRLFLSMDHCQSFAGEEVLYALLRTPKKCYEELQEQEQVVSYFMQRPEQRKNVGFVLAQMGQKNGTDFYGCLQECSKKEFNIRVVLHILNYLFLALSVALLFLSAGPGILFLILSLSFSVLSYFKERAAVLPYYETVRQVFNLVQNGKALSTACKDIKINGLWEEKRMILEDSLLQLRFFSRGAALFLGNNNGILSGLMVYFNMVFHVDLLLYRSMVLQLKQYVSKVDALFGVVGWLDAMLALGSYRSSLPYYALPQMEEGGEMAIEIYHPLLSHPVGNDYKAEKSILLTGSNASGKSTFLRSVAINMLLAQTVGFVCAREMKTNFHRIFSSMALQDNLQKGESYFIVEIKAMKRILNAEKEEGSSIVCFVDEVLRGTNTVERIAASSQILLYLSTHGVTCFAATHDLELSQLLQDSFDNYHFDEEISEDDIRFSYKLKPGRAVSRNAISLLLLMGYDNEIVEKAGLQAEDFLKNRTWSLK
ncbi:MAG: hypothetical protein ACI4DU_11030 [Lachnospiraceae bacterium]